jgi:predicted type IV restriction endonuclease
MTAQEWLCRSCLLAFLRGCGFAVSGEVQTNRGKADLVIEFDERYFVFELKMLPSTAEQALQQIIDKGYAKPYPNAMLLGLAIDGEKRQVMEWKAGNA